MKPQTVIAKLLFWKKSCPIRVTPTGEIAIPKSSPRGAACGVLGLGTKHLVPLLGFVVPTIIIGYGFVIPHSAIAGVNELTIGFGMTILSACVT